jgi:hypothetical protein
VTFAVKAAAAVAGKKIRVGLRICRERFLPGQGFREKLLRPRAHRGGRNSVSSGWEASDFAGALFTVDDFRLSGPGDRLADTWARRTESLKQLLS